MLHIIGIGLNDERDITVKGLEAVKASDHVYLESYTSLMQCSLKDLEKFYGKDVIEADREFVEQKDEIIEKAKEETVSLLVIGDVFSATTHYHIYREALDEGVEVEVIHNTSILNAVSDTGLQLYKFGRTASIPYDNQNVEAPHNYFEENQSIGLHTLFMLDIKAEEDRYMSVNEAIQYLLRMGGSFTEETLCVGCARIGSENAKIKAGTAKELLEEDFGNPPHCLIVPGKMHFTEEEALELWQ